MKGSVHEKWAQKVTKRRGAAIKAHNQATNIVNPGLGAGDFVLVRKKCPVGHKLALHLSGPVCIVHMASASVYEVQALTGGKLEHAHTACLMLF